MPFAKMPALRYRILHNCFSNRRKPHWTIAELIEKLAEYDIAVERRTVESDFRTMRTDERLGYFAPIAYHRTLRSFYYTNPAFTIDAIPLTADDLQSLAFATVILQQYKEAALVKRFEAALDKVVKVVQHLGAGSAPLPTRTVIDFERAPYYKGLEHFDALLAAIVNHQPLQVAYRKFSAATDVHEFHPYFLKEYRNRWYVLGHSAARGQTITLGLDRIEGIDAVPVPFVHNHAIQPEAYFEHTLGITQGSGPVETVELLFSPVQANYIKTQHLHHTQHVVADTPAGLHVSLRLIPNYELLQLILYFGAEVQVLQPAALRRQVAEAAARMAALYTPECHTAT